MSRANPSVVIMAGGTGGHVFPALAVAQALSEAGTAVAWLGTRRGIEAELVPAAGYPLHVIPVQGVRGRGLLGLVRAPFLLLLSLWQALRLLRRLRPDLVLGFGGFVSGPGGLAARLLGIPLVIHEQNAIAGTANRLLARIASRVLSAFPGVFPQAQVVGNPVRAAIAQLSEPAERYRARQGQPLRLLILGGSLGARVINERLPAALAELPESARPEVWHQTGRQHLEATQSLYRASGVSARVEAFIDDMASAYAWADLVICRSGALTLCELMAAGVASVLVPFPHAIDDHQTANARVLAEPQAALLVPESALSAERLATLLLSELAQRDTLLDMAIKARALAETQAAQRVADICGEIIRG